MSADFVPEDTLAVCTFQVGWSPQKLVRTRPVATNVHQCSLPMLTVEDRNTEAGFKCKIPTGSVGAWLAFVGGVILGVAACFTPVGWIAIGVCALCVAGGMAIAAKVTQHICTAKLKAGTWARHHPDVFFDEFNAITRVSILACSNGGFVRPVLSESAARSMARKIAIYNSLDLGAAALGAGVLGAAVPGLVVGLKAAGAIGAAKLLGKGALGFGAGLAVVGGLANWQARWMRDDDDLADNETYILMNAMDPVGGLEIPDSPADLSNIDDVVVLTQMAREAWVIQPDAELAARLDVLSKLSRKDLRRHPDAAKLSKDLRAGKYPDASKRLPELRKVLRPKTVAQIKEINSRRRVWNIKQAMKGKISKGLFLMPFISVFGGEQARKVFAAEISEDLSDGTSIHAMTPDGAP